MNRSLVAAERSSQVAADSLVLGSRPYVGIIKKRIEILEYGKPVVVEVTLVNRGNTPATEVVISDIGAKWGDDVQAMPYKMERLNRPASPILPGGETVIKISFETGMTEAQFRDLKEGKLMFSAFGRGEYVGLGGRYKFDFCGLTGRGALKRGELNLSDCDAYLKR